MNQLEAKISQFNEIYINKPPLFREKEANTLALTISTNIFLYRNKAWGEFGATERGVVNSIVKDIERLVFIHGK